MSDNKIKQFEWCWLLARLVRERLSQSLPGLKFSVDVREIKWDRVCADFVAKDIPLVAVEFRGGSLNGLYDISYSDGLSVEQAYSASDLCSWVKMGDPSNLEFGPLGASGSDYTRVYFRYEDYKPRVGEYCYLRGIDSSDPSQIYEAGPWEWDGSFGLYKGVYEWWNNKHYISYPDIWPYLSVARELAAKYIKGDCEVTIIWPDTKGPHPLCDLHKFGIMVARKQESHLGPMLGGVFFSFSCEPRWLDGLEDRFIEAVENHKNPTPPFKGAPCIRSGNEGL